MLEVELWSTSLVLIAEELTRTLFEVIAELELDWALDRPEHVVGQDPSDPGSVRVTVCGATVGRTGHSEDSIPFALSVIVLATVRAGCVTVTGLSVTVRAGSVTVTGLFVIVTAALVTVTAGFVSVTTPLVMVTAGFVIVTAFCVIVTGALVLVTVTSGFVTYTVCGGGG